MRRISLLVIFCFTGWVANAQDIKRWTLQECVDHALENNLDIKRSLLNVENSDINVEQAKMSRFPDLNSNASYGYNWGRSIDPTTNDFVNQRITSSRMSVNSNVVLFNAFRIRNSIKQNELTFESSKLDFEATKNAVLFNIITLYTNVLFNQELLKVAKSQLNSSNEQLNRTSKQVAAGALPEADRLLMEAQVANNEANVINSENNLIMAKIQLKQALQLSPSEQIEIVVPELEVGGDAILDQTAEEIYQIALGNMPQIKSAELSKESADWGVKTSKSALYPTLTFSGGLSSNYSDLITSRFVPDLTTPLVPELDNGGNPVFAPTTLQTASGEVVVSQNFIPNGETVDFGYTDQMEENLSKFVSFGLSIPIFNGFSSRANVQRAIIAKDRADIDDKAARNELWQTIEQAYADVKAASKSFSAAQKQVKANEESFRAMEQRKNAGAASFTDYQVAQNDLAQARADLIRAKYDFIFKLKVLDFYQGKPLDF